MASHRTSTDEAHRTIFEQAAAIVASEYGTPLRMDEVARRISISPRQLQRVFADTTGLGYRAYLRRVRMTHARDLLVNSDVPVKEVGRRVGYRDASQFSKAFKRTYGVSPSGSRSGRVAPSPRR